MIHPTALIDSGARVAADVDIGAYSVIGPDVEIGEGCRIGSHVVVQGRTRIGSNNRIHPFASIGGPPQDKKYGGEDTAVWIGDGNTIREYVTINLGTAQDAGTTRLGNDNWIMAYSHFAHDCQIGDHVIVANATQLAGHVHVGDWAILGATTLVHQFVRIGQHSFTGMGTYLAQDLPPFVTAAGNSAKPYGLNLTGLKRRGFSPDVLRRLKQAYRTLYREGLTLDASLSALEIQAVQCAEVEALRAFVINSTRGIIR